VPCAWPHGHGVALIPFLLRRKLRHQPEASSSDDATYFVADGSYDLEAFLDRPAAHADTELRLSASAAIAILPAIATVALIATIAVIAAAPAIATASVVAAAAGVAAIAATSAVSPVAIVVAAIISRVTRGAIATITAVSLNGAR
jgi:hypothetical protein